MEMAKANEEGVLLIIDDEEEVVKSLKRNFARNIRFILQQTQRKAIG